MTNISVLTKLVNLIRDQNLGSMKDWTERNRNVDSFGQYNPHLKKIRIDIRFLLNILSGDRIVEMLKDVLTIKELDELTSSKYKESICYMADYYKTVNLKSRHEIIRPYKKANFKYTEIKRLGFSVSKKLWQTCMNPIPRNKEFMQNAHFNISSNKEDRSGGVRIPGYLQNSIKSYLIENSNIASNRIVKNKKTGLDVPARILVDTKTLLFQKSPFTNEVSKSTFLKYTNSEGEFKKAQRVTDVCNYCEEGKKMESKICEIIKDGMYEIKSNYDVVEMKDFFYKKTANLQQELLLESDENEKTKLQKAFNNHKEILTILDDYEQIIFHKNIARVQRQAYYAYLNNPTLLENKVLIELDFKQKIVLGMSPRQISQEYFDQHQYSCLGFGIYFLDQEKKIKEINFNVISSNVKQDGYAAIRGFRILRQQDFFKEIETNDYIVWCDCGTHFRNQLFLGYLLVELAKLKIKVNVNFFCEKHGKNNRDAHFSNISKFVKSESLVKKLETSQDLVDAIIKRQSIANDEKIDKTKHVKTICLVLDSTLDSKHTAEYPTNETLQITYVDSFYNYRTEGETFKLVTSGLSSESAPITELKNTINKNVKIDQKQYLVIEEQVFPEKEVNFTNLYLKKCRIQAFIKKANLSQNTNDNFLGYFCLSQFSQGQDKEENTPIYCRQTDISNKKQKCLMCKSLCAFPIERILHPQYSISVDDINEELKSHYHPQSRDIYDTQLKKKRKRLRDEAARELADHYIFAHHHMEPNFFT